LSSDLEPKQSFDISFKLLPQNLTIFLLKPHLTWGEILFVAEVLALKRILPVSPANAACST
jgi:hypothetical protein